MKRYRITAIRKVVTLVMEPTPGATPVGLRLLQGESREVGFVRRIVADERHPPVNFVAHPFHLNTPLRVASAIEIELLGS